MVDSDTRVAADVPPAVEAPSRRRPHDSRWLVVPLAGFAAARLVNFLLAPFIARVFADNEVSSVFSMWDGNWYLRVVEEGFPSEIPLQPNGQMDGSTHGFFPGYPLAIRVFDAIPGVTPVGAGVAISVITSLLAAAVIAVLVRRLTDERTAGRVVLLLGFYPAAFVFVMVAPEGLFLLLSALALLWLVERRWIAAGVAAGLAGLVRPNVTALVVAAAVAAAIELYRERRPVLALVTPVLAGSGMLGFFAFLGWRTGEPLAYVRSKNEAWRGSGLTNESLSVADRFGLLFDKPFQHTDHFMAVLTIVVALVAVVLLWRLGPRLPACVWAYTLAMMAVAIVYNTYYATARQMLLAFPLLLPFARWRDDAWGAVLGCSAAMMIGLFFLAASGTFTP